MTFITLFKRSVSIASIGPVTNKESGFIKKMLTLVLLMFLSSTAMAVDYFWCASSWPDGLCNGGYWTLERYPSPQAFTEAHKQNFDPSYPPNIYQTEVKTAVSSETTASSIYSVKMLLITFEASFPMAIWRGGDSCPTGKTYNPGSGACESMLDNQPRKEQGPPDDSLSCSPTKAKGDPVNIATGNSFQEENDIPMTGSSVGSFSRYYNSDSGYWTHSDSEHLIVARESISLFLSNGRQLLFVRNGMTATPEASALGSLVKVAQGWMYTSSQNSGSVFDDSGSLISKRTPDGVVTDFTRSGNTITAQNNRGATYQFTQDANFQPTSLVFSGGVVSYKYDSFAKLTDVSYTLSGVESARHYSYSSTDFRKLTGITDERGIIYASWTYDSFGRAITSAHAMGANLTIFSYNADGSTTVTNELGKQTVYKFQSIQGVRRIVAIEGEPSANCPFSNSTFSYNDRGQLLSKIDENGIETAYTYNDRGLEVSRTEAANTPLARTVMTEWDPERFLRTRIVEPTRTTIYAYDSEGRLLSQQATPN